MRVLWRIVKYLGKYKGTLIFGYVALFIGLGSMLAVPQFIRYVVDEGIGQDNNSVVIWGSLAIIGLAILTGLFTYTRSYIFQALAERVATDLRGEYYRKLQRLNFAFYDRSQTGQLMSRGSEDINSIRRFLMFSMRMLVYGTVMMVAIVVLLFRADPGLATISLAVLPLLIFTAYRFGRVIRPRFLAIQSQFGEMSSVMQENLSGTRVVRVFAQEQREIDRFDDSLTTLYNRQIDAVRVWSRSYPVMTFLNEVGIAFVLWYGGRAVLNGDISVGTLVQFNLYLAMLAMPVRTLGWIVNSMARAIASGDRIFEIMDTVPAIRTPENPVHLGTPKGVVAFEDVSFSYPGTGVEVLSNISFEAQPGKIIALFGPTGSGKSTLTSLIPRFYDADSGRVTIDGVDVRDVDLEELRALVAFVQQDVFLFGGTIKENIKFGNSDATDEEIERAARIAGAHDFIVEQPNGYDTIVGERGVSLSGGQKQRVSIARALCADPRILILDDATSSVDTETEYAIQQELRGAMGNRTTFVIAQRLLSLKDADEILVLDSGRVVERGTHDELVARGGLYSRVYDLQLRDQEEVLRVAD
ncbi:MAG: ABC transporter ATP-binding protein [Thermomicrobiales bacterium]